MKGVFKPEIQPSTDLSMKGPFITSGIFHLIILIVAMIGMPYIAKDQNPIITPISIELVKVDEIKQNTRQSEKQKEPDIEKPVAPKPPERKPTPPKSIAEKPPEPAKKAPPIPTIETKKDAPKEKKPEPEPKSQQQKEQEEQEKFKNFLDQFTPDVPEAPKEQKAPESKIPDFDKQLTRSELDNLNNGIGRCWRYDTGIKNPKNHKPKLRIYVDHSMTIMRVEYLEPLKMSTDRTYRTIAEAASRALRADLCKKLNLPAEKYAGKYFDLTFDPGSM